MTVLLTNEAQWCYHSKSISSFFFFFNTQDWKREHWTLMKILQENLSKFFFVYFLYMFAYSFFFVRLLLFFPSVIILMTTSLCNSRNSYFLFNCDIYSLKNSIPLINGSNILFFILICVISLVWQKNYTRHAVEVRRYKKSIWKYAMR